LTDEVGRRWLREQRVWGAAPVDRVTVDRVTAASAIYRIGRTVYAPGCGLWFGVQWPTGVDPAARAQLERLLLHLGDRGLGGERSVGYGQFEGRAVPTPLDLPGPSAIGPCLTLSRYLPRRSELPQALRGEAAYRLDGIAGWLGAPGQPAQRRRQVHMLREGSVFEAVGEAPYGCLADVRPQGWDAHPIWRYGYACHVGLES
jgi:CRISPR-associated protein Csm4